LYCDKRDISWPSSVLVAGPFQNRAGNAVELNPERGLKNQLGGEQDTFAAQFDQG